MRLVWTLTGILAVLAAMAVPARAYPLRPPDNYVTLNTTHFCITYPTEHRGAALKVAILAEEAFATLTQRLKWTPETPIEILITDRTDEANGSSAVAPVQVMRLYLAQPHAADRLDYYDDYLRLLVYHEMTHAVHIDAARGIPLGFRYIFGRIIPIGHFQPQGLIEGQAVLQESVLTTKGRNRSPYSHMLLRMAALEDQWPPLDHLTLTPRTPLGGAVPYIWGGLFHQYLFDRFGMEKLADYNLKHAGQIWPYLFNHNARVIFGTHLHDLYDAWTIDMKRAFEQEKARIAADGLTAARRLTTDGYTHNFPRWLDDDTIVFAEYNRNEMPSLQRVDVRDPRRREHCVTLTFADTRGLDVATDGTIVFADNEPLDRWHAVYDLWRLEPKRTTAQRATKLARIADPAFVPGTHRVLGITQEGGQYRLSEVDLDSGAVRHLTAFGLFPGSTQFSGLAVHPGGRWAVTSAWHDDGNRDLFKIDLTTLAFTRLTADPEREVDPAFDPTGRYLLFSSGRTGVYNLYALDLQTDALFRVTNVLGGAFMPAVNPAGTRLAFTGYSAAGFDVYLMDFDPAQWRRVEREAIDRDEVVYGPISRDIDERTRAADFPTGPYEPWRTAWPHYWLPAFSFGTDDLWLGSTTTGGDIAGYHRWDATLMWGFQRMFLYAAAGYTWAQYTPALSFNVAHSAHNHGVILQRANGETVDYWERRVSGSVLLEYPLAWRHALFGGYLGQWRSDLEPVPEEVSPPPFTGYWSGVRVGWHYALAEEQDRRIVFPLALGATFYDPLLGSDVRQQIVGGQASAYFPLPVDRGGVYLRALGGWSFGDLLSQRTFYLGGMAQASPLNLNFLNDRFAVRGYDAGVDAGERIATGTAELRFPVAPIERGISTWPIYLRDLHGLVFGDAGFALERNEDLQRDDLFPATGLQLSLETVLFYFVTVDLQTTVAYGFRHPDDTGGFHWLVNLGGLLP